jgi:hypothetical protein
LLVVAGVATMWWGGGRATTSPLPAGLAFDVTASGLAAVRGPSSRADGEVEAYPNTRVRLAVTPRGAAVSGLELGLYRLHGERLERIEAADFREERGAATLSAAAADLVGREPGRHTLYVVVARRRDVPPTETDATGRDPELLLAATGRRLVYPFTIDLLPPASGVPDTAGGAGRKDENR